MVLKILLKHDHENNFFLITRSIIIPHLLFYVYFHVLSVDILRLLKCLHQRIKLSIVDIVYNERCKISIRKYFTKKKKKKELGKTILLHLINYILNAQESGVPNFGGAL